MKKYCFIYFLFVAYHVFGQKESFTLEKAIQYSWENNLTIQDQNFQTEISKIEVEKSKTNFLPSLGFTSSYNFQSGLIVDPTTNTRTTLNVQSGNFGLTTNVDLFNWQNIVRLKLTKLENEKLKYNTEITKEELLIQIVQAFYQLQFSKEQEKLINHQIENTMQHLNRIEDEMQFGNKSESDLLEMKANLATSKKQKVEITSNYKQAYQTLQNLLNKKDSTEYSFQEVLLWDKSERQIGELYEESLEKRPEIKQSKIDIEIASKNIDEQKTQYLPTLSAGYSLSTFNTNRSLSSFGNQIMDNRSHFFFFSLNVPIFNKLQTKKSINQSKIELERAELKTKQLEQEFYNLLSDLNLKTNNTFDQWEASEESLKAYQKSFEKTEDKFQFGLITVYEYLNAKNNLLQESTNNLIAKYTFYMNAVMLNWYQKGEIL